MSCLPFGNLLQFAIEDCSFIVDFPIKDGDFLVRYVSLPRGKDKRSSSLQSLFGGYESTLHMGDCSISTATSRVIPIPQIRFNIWSLLRHAYRSFRPCLSHSKLQAFTTVGRRFIPS